MILQTCSPLALSTSFRLDFTVLSLVLRQLRLRCEKNASKTLTVGPTPRVGTFLGTLGRRVICPRIRILSNCEG